MAKVGYKFVKLLYGLKGTLILSKCTTKQEVRMQKVSASFSTLLKYELAAALQIFGVHSGKLARHIGSVYGSNGSQLQTAYLECYSFKIWLGHRLHRIVMSMHLTTDIRGGKNTAKSS